MILFMLYGALEIVGAITIITCFFYSTIYGE